MAGFNTVPSSGGGGGQPNMTFVASIHMETYNRSWAQGGTPGFYGLFSANQENGYVYFVGATTTGAPLNRIVNINHAFTRVDVIAPVNDMISMYKAKVKSTTSFPDPFANFASFPSIITSSGNFVLPNNALPLVNVLVAGAGGGGHADHHGSGGAAGGGVVKLTAYQAVGTTAVTIAGGAGSGGGAGKTYFGNVYANGGVAGASHGGSGRNADSNHSNGSGAGGWSGGDRPGGTGYIQTANTGLGNAGSPTYIGGTSGGNVTSGGGEHHRRGGGGGGAGGPGVNGGGGNDNGGTGGPAHSDNLYVSTASFCAGGPGYSHNGHAGLGSHNGSLYGHGGHGHRDHGGTGGSGAVVVRYYIP